MNLSNTLTISNTQQLQKQKTQRLQTQLHNTDSQIQT